MGDWRKDVFRSKRAAGRREGNACAVTVVKGGSRLRAALVGLMGAVRSMMSEALQGMGHGSLREGLVVVVEN